MGMRWWEQAGINMVGDREAAAEAAEKDEEEDLWRGCKGRLPVQINSNDYMKKC